MPHDIQDFADWVKEHDEQWGFGNDFSRHNMLHTGLALCEEAGEVGGVIKKWDRAQGDNVAGIPENHWGDEEKLHDRLLEELVDLEIYRQKLFIMLQNEGIIDGDISDVFWEAWKKKFAVLHERWDPSGHGCKLCTPA